MKLNIETRSGGNPFANLCAMMLPALFFFMVSPSDVLGKVEIVEFEDQEKQALYQQMIQELRCLVCQNQNLADSNAELAVDLRRKTREMIEQGKTRQDIVSFMVERYGEFVLYRPAFNTRNLVLWLSPVVLLIVTLWIVLRARNRGKKAVDTFSEIDRQQVRKLLREQKPSGVTEKDPTEGTAPIDPDLERN